MEQQQRASLDDIINYTPEEYFSTDELQLIQSMFKDKRVMKVLRKVLIPTIADPDLPLEQFGNDFFLSGRQYSQIPDAEVKSIILAREETAKYIAGGLIRLQVLAHARSETPAQRANRLEKDSSK